MIYIVRHGQTDWNIEKKTQGHTDIPLNENGRSQARALATKISNLRIDKIVSSDLLRAKETAEIIGSAINKEVFVDKRLRERSYGCLEEVNRDTLTQDVWDIFNQFPERLNAEPKEDVFNRIRSFFDEIANSKDNILIVTHGGALRMIMYYSNNKKEYDNNIFLNNYSNIKINNADIFEWDKEIKLYKKE